MRTHPVSRAAVLGVLVGSLLAAGCAARGPASTPPRAAAPAGGADDVFLVVTDGSGELLGAGPVRISKESAEFRFIQEIIQKGVQDLKDVRPEEKFITPFKTITIFDMGDPCRYVIQGGRAVRVCW